ncbi:MAG TPA: alanine racemase [Blastocatellia bacterium]|nr:alanine racemase [Blastocatellia bacterium]
MSHQGEPDTNRQRARDDHPDPAPPGSRLTPTNQRPTWAEISLDNLVHNFQVMKSELGANVSVMPAVKANAYGHGAVECAQAFAREGAEWFGVALPEEGVELRDAGITTPILCLAGFWEGQAAMVIGRDLTPAVYRLDLLRALNGAARAAGKVAEYHIKIDTGMGRLGIAPSDLDAFLDEAARLDSIRLNGVMSHFASADEPEKADFTVRQMREFEEAVGRVRARGFMPTWIHHANSAAATAYAEARGNMVRLGGVLYGLWRDVTNPSARALDWRPVMSLHSRIAFLKTVGPGTPLGYGGTFVTRRESRIATLPLGYNDGLRRELSNRGRVIVRGQLAPIVGRVSMDLTLVDVTDVAGVAIRDEAVIIGRQGLVEITAEDVAAQIGTVSYEVCCGVSSRVPRRFILAE